MPRGNYHLSTGSGSGACYFVQSNSQRANGLNSRDADSLITWCETAKDPEADLLEGLAQSSRRGRVVKGGGRERKLEVRTGQATSVNAL